MTPTAEDNLKNLPSPSREKVLELMKTSYEEEFSRAEQIESKSYTMMEIASLVITLYGGFGLTISTKLFSEYEFNAQLITMMVGSILFITTIVISTIANRISNYLYAFPLEITKRNKDTKKVEINEEELNRLKRLEPEKFMDEFIELYITCITHNQKENTSKANCVMMSQIIFFLAIITIPFFVFITIFPNLGN